MKNPVRQRQSNIELLRIISIFGVILLHYCNPAMGGAIAYVQPRSANYFMLYALVSLFICVVDLFILISGYFLCTTKRRNLWKPIELICQVILFKAGLYLLSCLRANKHFALGAFVRNCIPANYFVILYIAVYVVSPFINIVFEHLSKKQMKLFIIVLAAVFSVYPTLVDVFFELAGMEFTGLSSIGAYGSQWGYTITNFVLMYIIGAYLRLGLPDDFRPSRIRLAAGIAGCVILLTAWAVWNDRIGFYTERSAWEYCNPIVILSAVKQYSLMDNATLAVALFFSSMPSFWRKAPRVMQ